MDRQLNRVRVPPPQAIPSWVLEVKCSSGKPIGGRRTRRYVRPGYPRRALRLVRAPSGERDGYAHQRDNRANVDHVVVLLTACRPDCLHREQETRPRNEGANYDSGTTHTFDRNRSWQTSLARVVHLVRPLAPPTSSAESRVISRKPP
jgi:hypothetical protein